jgi:hypothetical protein
VADEQPSIIGIRYKGVSLLGTTPELDEALARLAPGGLPGRRPAFGQPPPNDTLCRWHPGPLFPPKLNTLYWPTGAQRCAIGWFLVDDKILSKIKNSASAPILELASSNDPALLLRATLYPLQPLLLHYVRSDNPAKTTYHYVLPLVDPRYDWWATIQDPYFQTPATGVDAGFVMSVPWDQFVGKVALQIELPRNDKIRFITPDARFLSGDVTTMGFDSAHGDNSRTLADIVDATAWNNLQFLVRRYSKPSPSDDDYEFHSATKAEEIHKTMLDIHVRSLNDDDFKRRSGWAWGEANLTKQDASQNTGSFGRAGLPSRLALRAPRVNIQHRNPVGQATQSSVATVDNGDTSSNVLVVYRDTVQTFSDGSNLQGLHDLAKAVADEIGKWQKYFFDFTLNGIVPWIPNGLCDYIEFGCRHDDIYTRVRSRPVDWLRNFNGVFNHQLADAKRPFPLYVHGVADEDIAKLNTGDVTVENRTLTVFSRFGDVQSGDVVGLARNDLDAEGTYEPIVKEC